MSHGLRRKFRGFKVSEEENVTFFGLCGSPLTFQAFMNFNFADYIREGWLVIYMDDLAIGAHSTDDLDHKV